ncbi:MAG: PAS domain S-box protein [Candidatus Promineifilaceae bacterium]|nr:PAS domain S-box protein [Candidatus Promineifilaceae bacterium]
MRIGETLDATWDIFTKPAAGLTVSDGRYRARLLSALLLAIILFALLGMYSSVRVQGHVQPGLPLTTLVLLVAYGFSRTRAYVAAAALAIVALALPPVAAVINEVEYNSATVALDLMWLMLPMLLAGLLLSVQGVLIASVLILTTVSLLPLFVPRLLFSHVVFMLGFFGTVSVLIALTARIRRRYVEEAHWQIERQKDVERKLLRLKEFNESIINNMGEGIVVQDADGCFSFVNPAAAEMLGYDQQEMIGLHWTRVIPPEYHGRIEDVDRRRAEGETSRYEVELLSREGERVPVIVSGSPRQDVDGSFAGTLAVFTDISERKRAEEALRQLNEELEERVTRRTAELVAANERLKELDRLKTKFIADISHELRTPTMNLRLYLALLKSGDPSKRERHLATLEDEVRRLTSIVENIFDVSYLNEGRKDFPFEPVDLNALVQRVCEKLRPRAEEAGLTIRLSLAEDVPPIIGARSQLDQAVGHLVENAIKYTPEGEVYLGTVHDAVGRRVVVTVRDTGMGIPEEEIPHLFDRFYRSRRVGQSTIPGAGVGLAMAKGIVGLHGGEITVRSREGEGSVFTMWFPVQPPS